MRPGGIQRFIKQAAAKLILFKPGQGKGFSLAMGYLIIHQKDAHVLFQHPFNRVSEKSDKILHIDLVGVRV